MMSNLRFIAGLLARVVIEPLQVCTEASRRRSAALRDFSTGNIAKVTPVIRIDDRQLAPGAFYARALKLYWDFAHAVKLAA
jgi:branched-chain amino acid aminotransferase